MPLPEPKKDEKTGDRAQPKVADIEVRALSKEQAQVRVVGEKDQRKILGHAAVFYDGTPETEFQLWDDLVERIMPTAFDAALARGDDVRGLFNHDPSLPLGRTKSGTMQLRTDEKGLFYEIEPGDTTVARDVIEHIKRGDVDGSSFAFRPTDVDVRLEDGVEIREIRGVELFDVSPVTYPAYEAATSGYRTREQVAVECRALLAAKGQAVPETAVAAKPTAAPEPEPEDDESRVLKKWVRGLTRTKE